MAGAASARVLVSGPFAGCGTKRYKDGDGKWVETRVAVFTTDDPGSPLIVSLPSDDAEAFEVLLSSHVGEAITVQVRNGNYGKLWFEALV